MKALMLILSLILISTLFILPIACSNSSPTGAAPQTIVYIPATLTPTPSPTPMPAIEWGSVGFGSVQGSGTGAGGTQLNVNGIPEITAGVTLVGPGLGGASYPMTFVSTVFSLGFNKNFAQYGGVGTFTYTPGQLYVLTTYTSAGNASVTFNAPGGSFAVNAAGTTVTWSVEGNRDTVKVTAAGSGLAIFNSVGLTNDINTPYTIPAVIYSGYSSPATFTATATAADFEVPANALGSATMSYSSGPMTVIY